MNRTHDLINYSYFLFPNNYKYIDLVFRNIGNYYNLNLYYLNLITK